MFWRILFQLVRVGRTRLLLALVAVISGAAVSSALLNIHFDAESKLTHEFTTLGPNVVIAAKQQPGDVTQPLLDKEVMASLRAQAGEAAQFYPALYFVGKVNGAPVIVAGEETLATGTCRVGSKAARAMNVEPGAKLSLTYSGKKLSCSTTPAAETGAQEDNQIAIALRDAQELAGQPGKLSLIRARITGNSAAIESAIQKFLSAFPTLDVRPIRQIAEAEGQILSRIRGLIFATVALILGLTALCVLSAMTALAMEHRRDVGLMKALGGDMNRVLRLFICEIAGIGVAGGLLGWVGGIALSAWVGVRVFGTTIAPRAEVLPLILALMTAVALAGAFPLRLLSRVRPGVILRSQ